MITIYRLPSRIHHFLVPTAGLNTTSVYRSLVVVPQLLKRAVRSGCVFRSRLQAQRNHRRALIHAHPPEPSSVWRAAPAPSLAARLDSRAATQSL